MVTRHLLSSLLLAFVITVAVTHSHNSSAADETTGIEGTIVAGPSHGGPVGPGAVSVAPLAGVTFDVKKDDRVITTFQTDSQGHFKVFVPPGHYVVSRHDYQSAVGSYGPFELDVTPGKMASVHWQCDTGLR
jgi:hypothetical protein